MKTETFMSLVETKLLQMQQRKNDYPTVWRTIEKERTNDVKMTVMAEGFGRLAQAVNAHDDSEIDRQLINLAAAAAFWATDDESEEVDECK